MWHFNNAGGAQMSDIRVIAVTLNAKREPLMIMGTFTTTALHIASVTALPIHAVALQAELESIRQKAEKYGAHLVIEDPTGLFGAVGTCIRLDDKSEKNRPVVVEAMERYTSLSAMGGITYPAGTESQFAITGSLYNVIQNDSGRVAYQIDWDKLKDGSRVLLLSIYAAMCQTPYHQGYLARFFNALTTGASTKRNPFEGLEAGTAPKESNNTESKRYIL
ncbi:MAG: hypothetical protein ACRDCT_15125 [Shewanella sp.]